VTDRAKCTQETTDTVLSQCVSKLPDSARIRLPPLDHVHDGQHGSRTT
ncbi:unnamed protein product, partial [Rotaria sp. Silwood2]